MLIDFLDEEATNVGDCKEILAIPSIKLWIKWGSKFEDKLPLVKARYDFGTEINPEELVKLLTDERSSWDDTLMELTEIESVTPEVSIIHYVVKPPIFLMAPKDFAEKKIRLEKNGVYYGYHGAIPEAAFPCIKKYQRCETIYSGNILRKEDDSYVYYTFSQMNLNVSVY